MYIGNLRKNNGERLTNQDWEDLINQILNVLREKEYSGFLKTIKGKEII